MDEMQLTITGPAVPGPDAPTPQPAPSAPSAALWSGQDYPEPEEACDPRWKLPHMTRPPPRRRRSASAPPSPPPLMPSLVRRVRAELES